MSTTTAHQHYETKTNTPASYVSPVYSQTKTPMTPVYYTQSPVVFKEVDIPLQNAGPGSFLRCIISYEDYVEIHKLIQAYEARKEAERARTVPKDPGTARGRPRKQPPNVLLHSSYVRTAST